MGYTPEHETVHRAGANEAMANIFPALDLDDAIAAFEARDRAMDGRFVVAVKTTGIYCKPSCPARRPRRENVEIFADGAVARQSGYRPCLRCRPDEAARDSLAVNRAKTLIDESDVTPTLTELAQAVGYAPHHFQRLFKRDVGVSPAVYARRRRTDRLGKALERSHRITDAIYDAGYEAPSRAYADARAHFGMTPSAWRNGGAGVEIRFAVARTSLGDLLVAATEKGLCRISFDEGEAELRARFPRARVTGANAEFARLVTEVAALVDEPSRPVDMPLDVAGTAFQHAVWAALRAIPAGETRTYKELAEAIGRPTAVRAVGSACGGNHLAVLIPCHRVLRSDGALGGYAYGLSRKEALLKRDKGE